MRVILNQNAKASIPNVVECLSASVAKDVVGTQLKGNAGSTTSMKVDACSVSAGNLHIVTSGDELRVFEVFS